MRNLAAQRFGPKETFIRWHNPNIKMALDHILVNNKDLVTVYSYVVIERDDKSRASDHHPVMVDVTLK